jgi:hypothetical protein
MHEGLCVFVVSKDGKFRINMDNVTGKADYDSLVDAQMKVFDFTESGEAATFFAKRGERARKRCQAAQKMPGPRMA